MPLQETPSQQLLSLQVLPAVVPGIPPPPPARLAGSSSSQAPAASCSQLAGASPCKGQSYRSTGESSQGESGFTIPGCFLPLGFRSASFFTPLEITVQVAAGFPPRPKLASHARLLAVKCTEVTFPSGICFPTKLEDLGAHKTWVVPSSTAPRGLSCSGAAIPFPRHYFPQPLTRGRKKEGCSSGRRISPPRGFSRSRQGDPSLHPQRCRHPPAAAPHLPPEPGARNSRTHAPQSSFPAVRGSNKTSPCLSQVQLLSLTCSLASFLAVSQKSLPRAVPSPEQRRGRPCSQGWSSGASGLFLHYPGPAADTSPQIPFPEALKTSHRDSIFPMPCDR